MPVYWRLLGAIVLHGSTRQCFGQLHCLARLCRGHAAQPFAPPLSNQFILGGLIADDFVGAYCDETNAYAEVQRHSVTNMTRARTVSTQQNACR